MYWRVGRGVKPAVVPNTRPARPYRGGQTYNPPAVRSHPPGRVVRALAIVGLLLFPATRLAAQGPLPSTPLVFGDGRVVVGGDVSLTMSCSHATGAAACTRDTGFFNYSDYNDSTIRLARAGLSASVRLAGRLTALADVRAENTNAPRIYGAYLRFRPFEGRDFDIQAGRVPSTFGAFARRAYSTDNLVIGYPLTYQYLTSLRYDALPSTPDDLIRMRGRGWLSSFPIGEPTPEAGLPIINAFRWDTGVQAHGKVGWLEATGSVTTGSPANPLVKDDNDGRHLAARLAAQPIQGLLLGASVARAPYVDTHTASLTGAASGRFTERLFGVDAEYSRQHYIVRVEAVQAVFRLATIAPELRALASMVEGRYKLTPRVHVAARFDHLGFNTVSGPLRTGTWEAPVTRWEAGTGYALQRNVQLRASVQHNWRDGGRVRKMTAVSTQLLYWF